MIRDAFYRDGHFFFGLAFGIGDADAGEIARRTVVFGQAAEMLKNLFALDAAAAGVHSGADYKERKFTIARGDAIPLDAQAFDDKSSLTIRSGREELARVVMRYSDTHLFVGWMVEDTTPWTNAGSPGPLLFKTGDSVNVFMAPNQEYAHEQLAGTRVLLAPTTAGEVAVTYRPHGESSSPFVFESPVRKTAFAHTAIEQGVEIQSQISGDKTRYLVSAKVPWSVLGIEPSPGLELRGDVAVLFSDQTGALIGQRRHWADPHTNVINDVPTEAEFYPANWGVLTLE